MLKCRPNPLCAGNGRLIEMTGFEYCACEISTVKDHFQKVTAFDFGTAKNTANKLGVFDMAGVDTASTEVGAGKIVVLQVVAV